MKLKKTQKNINSCVPIVIGKRQIKNQNHSGKKGEECPFCHSHNIEKFEEYLQAKIKLDLPRPIVERIREGPPKLPQMPDSEVYGAISKVEADHGLTGEARIDMPLIAQYVNEEAKKHFYSSPKGKLFDYWKDYMERMHK